MKIIFHSEEEKKMFLTLSKYLHDFTVWEFRPHFTFDRKFPFIHFYWSYPVSLNLDFPLLNFLAHCYTKEAQEYIKFEVDSKVNETWLHEEAIIFWNYLKSLDEVKKI